MLNEEWGASLPGLLSRCGVTSLVKSFHPGEITPSKFKNACMPR